MTKNEAYVVRHKAPYRTRDVAFTDNVRKAMERYDSLVKAYPRERVWVVDLMNDRVIADSHPPK